MVIGVKCKNCIHWKGDYCETYPVSKIDHSCIWSNFSSFEAKDKKQRIINFPPRHMKVGWLKRLTEQVEEDKEKGE